VVVRLLVAAVLQRLVNCNREALLVGVVVMVHPRLLQGLRSLMLLAGVEVAMLRQVVTGVVVMLMEERGAVAVQALLALQIQVAAVAAQGIQQMFPMLAVQVS
jgi:hypothetical protein